MAKEADAHSAEDKAQREAIDAKNQLDSMVYQVEKMLKESGEKISGRIAATWRTLWPMRRRRWSRMTRR